MNLTHEQRQRQNLEDVIYAIDFTCRAVPNAPQSLTIIRRLCASTGLSVVTAQQTTPNAVAGPA